MSLVDIPFHYLVTGLSSELLNRLFLGGYPEVYRVSTFRDPDVPDSTFVILRIFSQFRTSLLAYTITDLE